MSIIQNALSGTMVAQAALNTVSQNIANTMTPGYTRQGVLIHSLQSGVVGPMSAGNGAQVSSLIRFSDDYKSLQMWHAASSQGSYETTQPYLTQLEQVMGDDAASINEGLDNFFASLNAASVEPTSSPLRQQVLTSADALAERFNSLSTVLSSQRASVYQQRSAAVEQINGLSISIATLNEKIAATQATGVNASGLIDERDLKIDELANLVGLQVVSQNDGTRNVALRNGQPLVIGGVPAQMNVQTNPDGSQSLKIAFAKETFTVLSHELGGELGGLGDYERDTLAPLVKSIQDTASALATNVNNLLTSGFGTNGTPGKALFAFDPTSSTGMLKMADGLQPHELGFSASATLPGNSDNLLALIDLQKQPINVHSLGNVLMGDVYTQLVAKLAMRSQQNQASLTTAQTVRQQAEYSWKATSGVNEDEEAINLMQYQQLYQSNMKVIAVANELFDSTLSIL